MKYLIDTDLVIDYFVGRIHATVLIDALVRDGLGICLVTYGELYEGVLGSKRRSIAEAAFLQFLTQVAVVQLDEETMRLFAGIRNSLHDRGLPIGDFDVLIASTAMQHDLMLVTRNFRHFSRIEGLRLYEFDETPR